MFITIRQFATLGPLAATALLVVVVVCPSALAAGTDDESPSPETAASVEEFIVTGSHIPSGDQFDMAFPFTAIQREALQAENTVTLSDMTNRLPFDYGSENRTDAADANLSTGTTNINLRGLGLGSTLVLLDGRRQTYSAITTNRGESFVDTASLIPPVALSRVEILRNGGTAIYGSDAVAGVVNFVTRRDFDGAEMSIEYQTTEEDSQEDILVEGIIGKGNGRGHLLLAVDYLDRSGLSTGDRDLSKGYDTSGLGQPGTFLLLGVPTGPNEQTIDAYNAQIAAGNAPFFKDPDCQEISRVETIAIPSPAGGPTGFCRFDFSGYFSLVAEETRLQGYLAADQRINDQLMFFADVGLSKNRTTRDNSPSFPALQFPLIAGGNPFNSFGTDVRFFGRALGAGYPPLPSDHDSDTWRAVVGLESTFGTDWFVEAEFSYSANDFDTRIGDTVADRFLAAIESAEFNPFGSAYFAAPGDAEYNQPDVIADFSAFQSIDAESELIGYDAKIRGPLWDLSAGTLDMAAGFGYRQEDLSYDYDDISNADNFLLFVGNPDFSADRDIVSAFLELSIPATGNIALSAALRYEKYDDFGDSINPKVGLRWTLTEHISSRLSFGTSFRAPTLFQQAGSQTTVANLLDPLDPVAGAVFRPVRTMSPEHALEPEEANNWNIGLTWGPREDLELNADYWRIDFTDLLTQQDAQAILNVDPTGPNVIRDETGTLIRVHRSFQNVAVLETDGFDFSGRLGTDLALGTMDFSFQATYVNRYEFESLAGIRRDGAGFRNEATFASPIPRWRGNFRTRWAQGHHEANAFLRYIDSFTNDESAILDADGIFTGTLEKIDSMTTVDAQYNYHYDDLAVFTLGILNLLDEQPPEVSTTNGYESRIHDPRGRLFYARLSLHTK
jgi:iron complex outermembrane receptor protein